MNQHTYVTVKPDGEIDEVLVMSPRLFKGHVVSLPFLDLGPGEQDVSNLISSKRVQDGRLVDKPVGEVEVSNNVMHRLAPPPINPWVALARAMEAFTFHSKSDTQSLPMLNEMSKNSGKSMEDCANEAISDYVDFVNNNIQSGGSFRMPAVNGGGYGSPAVGIRL